MRIRFAAIAAALLTWSNPQERPAFAIRVSSVNSPAGSDSAQPQFSISAKGILLSWIEKQGSESALRYAERTPAGWTAPRTAASGSGWFVNWADVPSVVRLADGTLIAHWLQKNGADTYAYDVRLSRSTDDGKTWSASILPYVDSTKSEHGFASLFQMPGAGLGLVWLDGRGMTGHEGHGQGDMALRFGAFSRDGKQTSETPIDTRVCECCPTAVAVTADGPIVAYRDRGAGEVRDIYVSRLENGKWTEGVPVHQDDWRINACPVNGPSLSAAGRTVVVGWFTAKDDQPKSFAAFSTDAGRTFGAPIRLDDDASLGRVDVELLPDGSAAAAYIEFSNQRAEMRLRRITRDSQRSAPVTVSNVAANRSSGYPRMAFFGDELVFAWVDREGGSQVRTAAARISR